MPCMCWYDPSDERKKHLKNLCQQVVDELKRQSSEGDPTEWGYDGPYVYASNLIKHLYTGECDEKPS